MPKNSQLIHFLTKGYGQYYDFHRVGVLAGVAGSLSYLTAKTSRLKSDEFALADPSCLYAAELILDKQHGCGVVAVIDDVDHERFEPGYTRYQLTFLYNSTLTKADLVGDDRTYGHLLPFYRSSQTVCDYMTAKQDMGIEKQDPKLASIERALEETIRRHDPYFGFPALL